VAAVVDRALQKQPSNRFATAREMLTALDVIPPAAASTAERWWKRVAALAVGGAIAAGAWFYSQNARTTWAREQAIPEIERLIDAGRFVDAFQLAAEARRVIPMDPAWARLDPVVTRQASIQTVPDGATVCYQNYAAPADQWTCLGETPIQEASIPNAVLTWRAQKPGFEPALDVTTGGYLGVYPGAPAVIEKTFKLQRPDAVPPGMVYVTPGDAPFRISVPRLDHLPGVELRDFWIDRTEVTNRDFARFVDSGGYRDPRYWRVPFERDGRQLLFEDAIALFKDASGRPGPATWEAGRYPEGQDDYPVSGVSWYEAAAYAVFVGKSLPTIYHWSRAAGHRLSGAIVPRSNFSNRGPMKAGGVGGMHHFGTVDLAGNAKEWCWNRADSTRRYILGGAWDEPVYMFNDLDARSPFDRAANFGFRLVKYGPDDALPGSDNELIAFEARDYRHEKPATDELFEAYLRLYAYDRGDLATKAETSDDSHPEWRVERVSFQAAYADERVPAYQAVVIFPGSDAFTQRSSAQINPQSFDWIIRSGRAVMYPIYKNTYERGDGLPPVLPSRTVTWRDDVIASAKDVRRAVDYLESRPDIDRTRLAFLGGSRGAAMGPIFVAVEPRFKAALLYLGGFFFQHSLPEVDAFNFAPRVRVPVLLLSGRFDFIFPTDTSQLPMFDLFQPPDGQKRRVVYDTGHNLPRAELIRETLEWLDTYLGKPSE
jgi:formylglycine-generating enzyme required for sulfatase activity/predicted esterase